jgi:hypothetical protein
MAYFQTMGFFFQTLITEGIRLPCGRSKLPHGAVVQNDPVLDRFGNKKNIFLRN